MSEQRPAWAQRIARFVGDEIVDDDWRDEDDDVLDKIEAAVHAVMCGHFGHEIVDDMCMNPDHRYCVWCGCGVLTLGSNPSTRSNGV